MCDSSVWVGAECSYLHLQSSQMAEVTQFCLDGRSTDMMEKKGTLVFSWITVFASV